MERTKTFVNGGRLYPADINAIEDRAAEMLEGTAAAIPGSHFAGRLYRATDIGCLFIDNGTAWIPVPNLPFVIKTSSATVKNGEFFFAEKGLTATLPATVSTGNQMLGVYSATNEVVTIKCTGEDSIGGDFFFAKEAKLLAGQHLILQSTEKVWRIIAGEPQREQTYSAQVERASGTEFEPSATRPAQVVIAAKEEAHPLKEIFVGGVLISYTGAIQTNFASFIVPPKVKWKATTAGAAVFFSSYLLL